jgi:hypothetical protein
MPATRSCRQRIWNLHVYLRFVKHILRNIPRFVGGRLRACTQIVVFSCSMSGHPKCGTASLDISKLQKHAKA